MAVTTQLIGKLGGGGAPETAVTGVTSSGSYGPPAGWRKAAGVFTGESQTKSIRMFDEQISLLYNTLRVNGGGVVTGEARFQNVTGTIFWVRLE